MFETDKLWNGGNIIARDGLWDRIAVTVSGLCLVHCISTMLFVAIVSSAGGMLLDPVIHEVGLGIAMALGMFALGKGVLDHGYIMPAAVGALGLGMMMGALTLGHHVGHGQEEVVYTMLGVAFLALGHDLNYRATH